MQASLRILSLILLVHTSSGLFAQETIQTIVRKVKPSVVTIFCADDKGNPLGQGTGFFIDSGKLVTNRHVVEQAAVAICKDRNNNKFSITSVIADRPGVDLIILQTLAPDVLAPALFCSNEKAEEGQHVVVIGTPVGLELTVSDGIISSIRDMPGSGRVLQLSAPISSGSSGGPVVNLKGEVVGIVLGKNAEGENINFAIPVSRLKELQPIKRVSLAEWSKQSPPDILPLGEPSLADKSDRKFIAEYAYGRGLDYYRQKNWQQAIDKFTIAVKEHQYYPEAWYYLGRSELEAGHVHHAVPALENAVKLSPQHLDAYYYLGCSYFLADRLEDAEVQCRNALKIDSTFALAYHGLARTELARGNQTGAIALFRKSIHFDPSSLESHYFLGHILLESRKLTEADEQFRIIAAVDSTYPLLWTGRGLLALARGRNAEAASAFERATMLAPNDPVAYHGLGRTLLLDKKPVEAVPVMKKAVALSDGKEAMYLVDLGVALNLSNHPDEAYDAFRRAIAIDPDNPLPHYVLGKNAILFLHDESLALKEYKILQKLHPKMAEDLFNLIYKK